MSEASQEGVMPAPLLSDWRVRTADGKEHRLKEPDLIDYLWYWRNWYPPTAEARKRTPFKPGFDEELRASSQQKGLELRSPEHLARLGYENRAFIYEFDARENNRFRFGAPFPLLAPEIRLALARLEAEHRVGVWTMPENIFDLPMEGKHGNAVPRKQPHPWQLLEEKDRCIFLQHTLDGTRRSQWSKLRRELYEPYAKVIYSQVKVQ